MSSKVQNLIDNLPIPQINKSNQRFLAFTKVSIVKYEIEFGEMILGPYSFEGSIKEFIYIYFSQIAKINKCQEDDIEKRIVSINEKNNNNYIYETKDINYILQLV